MKTFIFALFMASLSASSSFAAAGSCDPSTRTLSGDKAQAFMMAMKAAGFKSPMTGALPTQSTPSATAVFHYHLGPLGCEASDAGVEEDGLSSYNCNSIPKGVANNSATAKIIFDALSDLGVFADGGMSHSYLTASNVGCSVTAGNTFAYGCVVTAVWADTCSP